VNPNAALTFPTRGPSRAVRIFSRAARYGACHLLSLVLISCYNSFTGSDLCLIFNSFSFQDSQKFAFIQFAQYSQ
jgi:hypothetical protein